jgi:hypothetical protein
MGLDLMSLVVEKLEPILTPSQEMEPLPKTWQKYLEHAGQLMSHIITYDQERYEVRVEEGSIKIKA